TVSWMRHKEIPMRPIAPSLFAMVILAGVFAGCAQATRTDSEPAPESAKGVHGALPEGSAMPTQINNLYLLEDLDDANKTRQLAQCDLAALRTDADWIKSFVARPHKELGRDGPVSLCAGGLAAEDSLARC